MMARLFAILTLALLALPAIAADSNIPNFKLGMPKDVVAFFDRQEQCLHWSAEDPSDPKRAKQIEAAMTKLKCDALPDDMENLRDEHHNDANILDRLSQADDYYSATD